jgi:iron(III) transport system permease protein
VTSGGGRRPPRALLAAAAILTATTLLPLAYLLIRVVDGGSRALEVLGETATWRLVGNTVLLGGGVVVASVAIALPLAWLVTRTDLPGRRVWGVAAALPLVIPSYVAALCLLGLFGPEGLLSRLLGGADVPELTGYWGALLALTLASYPYVFLLAQSAFRDLDPSFEEAARSLGARRSVVLVKVVLPALRPAVGLGSLLVLLYVLSDFGVVSLMRYDALTRAIYLQYRSLFDRTPAATLSLLLVVLTAIALTVEQRTRHGGRSYRTSPGAPRRAQPKTLGRWTAAAVAYCSLATGVFLIAPATVLVYWLVHGIHNERSLNSPIGPALHSLLASGLAALVAVAVALPIATLAVRYGTRSTRLLGRLTYVGNALPGLVIALSLVFFAARYASPVYQTLALLVFAYVVRFLPQAMSGVDSALIRVSPRLEDASRALGRGPLATLRHVTVPLARSGLLAGGALVFLSAMKELPATILLRPIGFDTLATEIWRQTQVAAYSRAALPALILICLSAPVLYVVSSPRRAEQAAT